MPNRGLTLQVYVPAAIYGAGMGAAAPIYALRALDLGASAGVAGVVVALSGLGLVLGDLPAGATIARIGERWSVVLGSSFGALGVVLCIVAPNLGVLAAGMVLSGIANAVWNLARQTYVVGVVEPHERGRALSAVAGSMRFGFFVGPFVGAGVVHEIGLNGGLAVQLVATVVAGTIMATLPDLTVAQPVRRPLSSIVFEHRRLLLTLGSGSMLMGAARASRTALLPLWADHVGMSPAATSLAFGIGGAIDVAMSYPAGVWMDRFGRHAIAVPSMILFALGYLGLPLATGPIGVAVVSVVLGLGNGLSNGVIMTVGADVAPPGERAEFLGAWRVTHDVGMCTGPVAVGAISAAATLTAAPLAIGALALTGAAALYRWVPRVTFLLKSPTESTITAEAR